MRSWRCCQKSCRRRWEAGPCCGRSFCACSPLPIALIGLLLLLTAPLLAEIDVWCDLPTHFAVYAGSVIELSPDGKALRAFDGDGRLRVPHAATFAPPAIRRHGFTPGFLYVLNGH